MKAYQYVVELKDKALSKAKRLAAEMGVLDSKTSKAAKSMTTAGVSSNKMAAGMDRGANSGMRLDKTMGSLVTRFIGPLALIAGLTAFTTGISKAGDNMQQTEIAFDTMLQSADKSKRVIADLNQFSNVTPFTNEQVFKSAKSLLAYNIEAKELLPTLRMLGDISSGVGREKLPNLILAFGQVKAASRLTGMELRQFTETGVPLLDELAKVTGKSVAVIKEELIPQGKISFDIVKQAMRGMTEEGGKFFQLMEKQSKTFGGRTSTLKGKLGLIAIELGKDLNESLTPGLEAAIRSVDSLLANMRPLTEQYFEQKSKITALSSEINPLVNRYEELISKSKLNKTEQGEVKTIIQKLADAMPSAVTQWDKYGDAVSLSTTRIKEHLGFSKEALKLLNKDAISEKRTEIFDLEKRASLIGGKLSAIAKHDGFLPGQGRGGALKRVSEDEIKNLRSQLKGLSGKNGLLERARKDLNLLLGISTEPDSPDPLGDGTGTGGLGSDGKKGSGIDSITAGGSRSVTVNVNGVKFAETIEINPETIQEGLDELEPKMREFFVRILNGGIHTAANN